MIHDPYSSRNPIPAWFSIQRYMVEEQELPVRTLDFDYERERVAQARDTFIAHKVGQ